MSVQKTLEDFFSARTTSLAPTPKHFYVRLAALTTHGGFMSVLPLVVEFLVCGEPLRELELRPEMKEYEGYHDTFGNYKGSELLRPGDQIYLEACERALAVARKRHSSLRALRLVSKPWRDAAKWAYDRELLLQETSKLPPPEIVPFPFRCIRCLKLDAGSWYRNSTYHTQALPLWFDNLALVEELHLDTDRHFCLPAPPVFPRLRRFYSNYSDFGRKSEEGLRDRPLEVVSLMCDPGVPFDDPEWDERVARVFQRTVCGLTIREIEFYGQRFIALPEGLRGLRRLTKLDISFSHVTTLPEWLGESPLVELKLGGSTIETLPRSLRSCTSLRLLNLSGTPLGTADSTDPGCETDLGPRTIYVPPGLVEPRGMGVYVMNFEDVPESEMRRRTNELMGISLALPDLRIRFSFQDESERGYFDGREVEEIPNWHARCGKPWTDPTFDERDD
jgi:hypothetical protein